MSGRRGDVAVGGEYEAYLYVNTCGYLWWDNQRAIDLFESITGVR